MQVLKFSSSCMNLAQYNSEFIGNDPFYNSFIKISEHTGTVT